MIDGFPHLHIANLGGTCPVQAEGTIAGLPFYFRARGAQWSFSVGADPIGAPDWRYVEPYGDQYEAGWMEQTEAIAFIIKAACFYLAGKDAPARAASRSARGEADGAAR